MPHLNSKRGVPGRIDLCRQDSFDHIHFDLKQQNCIKWHDAQDLKQQLTDRLRAELGQGPRVA